MKCYQLEIFCFDAEICQEDFSWVDITGLGLPEELLWKMADLGIIEIRQNCVRSDHIPRIFKALRLRRTLGVNLAGAGIILDLLDKLEEMKEEIKRLKERF